jgi:cell shape-determining protein MreC
MALVIKGNKQLTVAHEKVKEYLSMGYSEIDEEGNVLQVGDATDLKDIKAENDTLKAKLAEYKENVEKLDQFEEIQKENEDLKAEKETLVAELEPLKAENVSLKEQLEAAAKGKAK